MRVTHSMMYDSMTQNMNGILSDYMNTGIQMSTQKRINNPSDDPTGYYQVLKYRASIVANDTYISNSQEAASWLASTDGALQQAQTILTRLSELAEQASTGTYTAENRLQIASEVQQLFEQLVNIANTEYNGTHIFAGHKTDGPAYQIGLGVMTQNPEFDGTEFNVEGQISQSTMIRFTTGGEIGKDEIQYQYSNDGGKTWVDKTLAAGSTTLEIDGAMVHVNGNPTVNAFNPDEEAGPNNGSMLVVRPSAIYVGDDNDYPPEFDIYGDSIADVTGQGVFKSDVQVKFPQDVKIDQNGTFEFQYSTDNGLTWQVGKASTNGTNPVRLVIPGGYVDVQANGDTISAGSQFVVRPNRAQEQGFEIAPGDYVQITNDGKDIFGGLYQDKGSSYAKPVADPNIFETISDFYAYCQTNNQDGCGQTVEDLRKMSEHLLTQLAAVGGKSNRVEVNMTVMQTHKDNQTTRKSNIEDADITSLLTTISKQQVTYQAVLQSSSMIMNMSLLNYL